MRGKLAKRLRRAVGTETRLRAIQRVIRSADPREEAARLRGLDRVAAEAERQGVAAPELIRARVSARLAVEVAVGTAEDGDEAGAVQSLVDSLGSAMEQGSVGTYLRELEARIEDLGPIIVGKFLQASVELLQVNHTPFSGIMRRYRELWGAPAGA